MGKGWTEERRKRQAEIIRRHKPWTKSTGPKTKAGKARSARNALKHGWRCRTPDDFRYMFWLNAEFVRLSNKLLADLKKSCKNKELKKYMTKLNQQTIDRGQS